ncbi:MAG: 2-phospho-L-lactate transferase [Myxococcales bacterium]|nr:2-phospho-L-lactate transferase [Myxococcales bacterium]MDH3484261.1 2-phospho-L-lactate transferase [Myxococcales bacterium]
MNADRPEVPRVVALAGGVGGARLVDGLDRVLPAGALTIVVNTGDDFSHWGLHISPDLDTVMYTLAGLAPEERGWGIEGDTFHVLEEAERRGADAWFRLGDRDLMTHLLRSRALAAGDSLTEATAKLCSRLEVTRPILPMTDASSPTTIVTRGGDEMAFQDWLVRARAGPEVQRVELGKAAQPTGQVIEALRLADLVVICPSNPYVSIGPILSVEGVRGILREKTTVGVSPILGGRAVKGPLSSMIAQLEGKPASAQQVATHYEAFLDGFVVHPGDAFSAAFPVLDTNILIQTREDRVGLARALLDFARSLR